MLKLITSCSCGSILSPHLLQTFIGWRPPGTPLMPADFGSTEANLLVFLTENVPSGSRSKSGKLSEGTMRDSFWHSPGRLLISSVTVFTNGLSSVGMDNEYSASRKCSESFGVSDRQMRVDQHMTDGGRRLRGCENKLTRGNNLANIVKNSCQDPEVHLRIVYHDRRRSFRDVVSLRKIRLHILDASEDVDKSVESLGM